MPVSRRSFLRVDISEETNKFSYLRLMPKYKVRAEGDNIRMADQVSLALSTSL